MPEDTGGEKSLPASAQKLQRAREEGNVARSQDLNSAWALLVALIALAMLGPQMFRGIVETGVYFIGDAHRIVRLPWDEVMKSALWQLGWLTLPFMAVMLAAGLAVSLLQTGFLLTGKPLIPKLNRLNPISGMQKFFSLRSLIELVKSIAKLIIVAWIVWITVRSDLGELIKLMALQPYHLVLAVADLVVSIWWRVVAAMIVLGIFDYGYQRWQFLHDQRMTFQEARQEAKEMEGDPNIKRRVRQLQRQMAMQRMMAEVPQADVIITNPTTYAVALRYKADEMEAPVVVAKGMRIVAERIREIGAKHRVPILERPELARNVYKSVEVGRAIPEGLFRAVAEVLSYVYKIDRRAEKQRERANAATRKAV
ncbi:MAG: flagellar biosynthesis protein FlhB [Candidatus Hydrogenedentes bacterium]|nr:flagellar biosynthesis protein FlhB [Candidatus Hydrogenedentota bacterium]